ncbi:MAG: hypothetical protein AB1413_03295 [Thermodesulfobacteriota bacterium]
MEQLQLLLIVIPLSGYFLAKTYRPEMLWRVTGITFGMVVAPVSLCLLNYAYVPIIGKLFGLVGLLFNLIHGAPGYFMVVGMGFQEPGVSLSFSELALINLVNGILWSVHYGLVGYNFDVKWAESETPAPALRTLRHKPASR